MTWYGNDVSRNAILRYGRTTGGRDKGAKDTRYEARKRTDCNEIGSAGSVCVCVVKSGHSGHWDGLDWTQRTDTEHLVEKRAEHGSRDQWDIGKETEATVKRFEAGIPPAR